MDDVIAAENAASVPPPGVPPLNNYGSHTVISMTLMHCQLTDSKAKDAVIVAESVASALLGVPPLQKHGSHTVMSIIINHDGPVPPYRYNIKGQ